MRFSLIFALLGLCHAGCGGCTEIGCSDGVSLHLTQDVDRIREVELIGDDRPAIRCPVGSPSYPCFTQRASDGSLMLHIAGTVPEGLVLRLFDQAGALIAEESVQPQVTKSQPNGKDCPPECTTALVVR